MPNEIAMRLGHFRTELRLLQLKMMDLGCPNLCIVPGTILDTQVKSPVLRCS